MFNQEEEAEVEEAEVKPECNEHMCMKPKDEGEDVEDPNRQIETAFPKQGEDAQATEIFEEVEFPVWEEVPEGEEYALEVEEET